MLRLHLLELEDQAWFPAIVRDLATDYLQFAQTATGIHKAMTPVIREALVAAGVTHIIDLCSGGSGPLIALLDDLRQSGVPATATLTDLFPNLPAFERAAGASDGAIGYVRAAVDARSVPRELKGLRTLFNGFHHFRPADATAILADAADAAEPIAIFEFSRRSFETLIPILFVPLFVWLSTPFMRPITWKRLLFTYPIPLVPFTCLWDGVVSQLRAYTIPELRELARAAGSMEWRADSVPIARGRGRLTYLIGWPTGNHGSHMPAGTSVGAARAGGPSLERSIS
jgi:hypothetical protein